MHVVLINGPAGAGKNTLATAIKTQLQSRINNSAGLRKLLKRTSSSIAIEEHKQVLIDMLFAFAESISAIELGTPKSAWMYERLKDMVMLGQTGRTWQITWADSMRGLDPSVFVDAVHTKIRNMDPDIALVPDCGFPDEYHSAVQKHGKDRVITVYLDGWKEHKAIYSHGERFANDIRICLRDFADVVNPTAANAAGYILGRMEENAKQKSLF